MTASSRRVVVVGSGAAGLTAAVAAAQRGAGVTLLESAPTIGGTTAYSGGGIWVPNNPAATAAGIDDSVEDALAYLRSLDLGDTDPGLAETYVRQGARVVRAVEQATALRWHHLVQFPDYHAELPGGRREGRSLEVDPLRLAPDVLRMIRPDPYAAPPITIVEADTDPPDGAEIARRRREGVVVKGRALVGGLLTSLRERGGSVRTGARARRLLTDPAGNVVGVEAGGEELPGSVVIATGGFERDPALVRAFLRGPMLAPASPPTNRGDGLRLGMTVGAGLGNMSEAWWCPALAVPGETLDAAPFYRMLFRDRGKPGGIIVDGRGERFANEATNYNDFGRALHAFDPARYCFPRIPSWLVFDAARRHGDVLGPLETDGADPAWLIRAGTLAELAARIGVPAAALEATVARYNRCTTTGSDPDFGRGAFAWDWYSSGRLDPLAQLRPLTEAPFYAVEVLPGCLGTKGGLKTDGQGRVQRADGRGPIEGLFAAGNAAANPFGCAYPGGGATIGPALVFGWLAGEAAAG
jgi:3-oxosteroid 1-dehydrogenase